MRRGGNWRTRVLLDDEQAEELAARVKKLRAERGWSQRDLAEKADMAHSTVGRIESGGPVTEDAADAVAFAAGMTLRELLGGDAG